MNLFEKWIELQLQKLLLWKDKIYRKLSFELDSVEKKREEIQDYSNNVVIEAPKRKKKKQNNHKSIHNTSPTISDYTDSEIEKYGLNDTKISVMRTFIQSSNFGLRIKFKHSELELTTINHTNNEEKTLCMYYHRLCDIAELEYNTKARLHFNPVHSISIRGRTVEIIIVDMVHKSQDIPTDEREDFRIKVGGSYTMKCHHLYRSQLHKELVNSLKIAQENKKSDLIDKLVKSGLDNNLDTLKFMSVQSGNPSPLFGGKGGGRIFNSNGSDHIQLTSTRTGYRDIVTGMLHPHSSSSLNQGPEPPLTDRVYEIFKRVPLPEGLEHLTGKPASNHFIDSLMRDDNHVRDIVNRIITEEDRMKESHNKGRFPRLYARVDSELRVRKYTSSESPTIDIIGKGEIIEVLYRAASMNGNYCYAPKLNGWVNHLYITLLPNHKNESEVKLEKFILKEDCRVYKYDHVDSGTIFFLKKNDDVMVDINNISEDDFAYLPHYEGWVRREFLLLSGRPTRIQSTESILNQSLKLF